ncbi:NAD(P)H-quinone oxidoreductase subunit S, chloroplastic [Arachis hypogaea]|uniref:Uncharacterized protein n=1 Tax=Arachis hypogaea TaxID=3818 RepID=A0A445DDK0_ARAHY|nr:NAD(P)H-quinone oxidoreductase subunit S, chloroplastic [Arachis hypogaea]QHO39524.1 NAD(P)H-quinone oxidoreductase subunit S [Arachis hypogaea]RYR61232.1 hypothetical protein Ahy_A04g018372 [Arachis hypogaea]
MASLATLYGFHHGSLLRTQFLGQDHNLTHYPLKHPSYHHNKPSFEPHAKFNIVEIMGGRGICNGEKGLQLELERQVVESRQQAQPRPQPDSGGEEEEEEEEENFEVSEDAFEKEMMGLTGGFPGGEKGLQKFIEENPPSKSKHGNLLALSR